MSDPLDRFPGYYEDASRPLSRRYERHIVTTTGRDPHPDERGDFWFHIRTLCGAPSHGRLVHDWDLLHMYPDDKTDHLCQPCVAEWMVRTRGRDDVVAEQRRREEASGDE